MPQLKVMSQNQRVLIQELNQFAAARVGQLDLTLVEAVAALHMVAELIHGQINQALAAQADQGIQVASPRLLERLGGNGAVEGQE